MTGSGRLVGPWARASLRTRLLLLALTLLTCGFTAFSLVTGNALRADMTNRVDAQLRTSARVFAVLPPLSARERSAPALPAGLSDLSTNVLGHPVLTYVAADGRVQRSVDSLAGQGHGAGADGPALPRLDEAAVRARGGRAFTVDGTRSDTRWRVIAVPRTGGPVLTGVLGAAAGDGGSVVVATSLADVDGTVDRMWHIHATTGLCLLGALALAGWFAVRSGLGPLTRIEQTAAEIARGDLSRRVPRLSGPGTEIGSLAASLNAMLGRLEAAFAARERSEARMSRFVADAGHELRTPLAGIKGLTDLHHMGALPEGDVDRTMSRIARESERLTRLVEDMLLLARLDEHALALARTGEDPGGPRPDTAFPLDLERTPTDLRTLAADALHDLRALAPERPVTLTGPGGEGPPGSAPVLADETRLRQVVTNLVGNAVTHTPPGTPVRVGVGTLGEESVLEIADEGPGIDPGMRERVFERFSRADGSRSRGTGGAGLGLAIVRSLVAAHAGRVEVLSAPGEGATFRVLLPSSAEAAEAAEDPAPAPGHGHP
ncbi:HAMP domain-containing sensor histidine kinase [Streptomyces sp. NPDC048664]|uniref:sensor histidine kinase n=1 Tax=Streptomyces sp. NPDC048664 TaxID=3154505 RepID=UPI003449702D